MYTAHNYDQLLGTPGFSDNALQTHFKLYQGYVTNTNKLLELLAQLVKDGKTATPEYAELHRRFGWEFNGMRLHELYFGAMKKGGVAPNKESALHKKIISQFGSFDAWAADFKATATMRGIGWTILYYDPVGDKLLNVWVNEHDAGHLASLVPILNIDVFEHAFMLDYGLKRADYVDAFLKAVDWSVVEKRLA